MTKTTKTTATASVKTVKQSIIYKVEVDGVFKLRNKSFEHVVDEAGMEQLASNIELLASQDNIDLFKADVDGEALFIVCKAGKSLSPNVAYNPVTPWETVPGFKLYEGVESLKNRYELKLKSTHKAIDLITMECEAAKARKASKKSAIEEATIASLNPAEQVAAKKFLALFAAAQKASNAAEKAEAEAEETEAPDTDVEAVVNDL